MPGLSPISYIVTSYLSPHYLSACLVQGRGLSVLTMSESSLHTRVRPSYYISSCLTRRTLLRGAILS